MSWVCLFVCCKLLAVHGQLLHGGIVGLSIITWQVNLSSSFSDCALLPTTPRQKQGPKVPLLVSHSEGRWDPGPAPTRRESSDQSVLASATGESHVPGGLGPLSHLHRQPAKSHLIGSLRAHF